MNDGISIMSMSMVNWKKNMTNTYAYDVDDDDNDDYDDNDHGE